MALSRIIERDKSVDKLARGGSWQQNDEGRNCWVADDTVRVTAETRCLGYRYTRRSSGQCSGKASVKWGASTVCKRCADEVFPTAVLIKQGFWAAAADAEADPNDWWAKVRVRHMSDEVKNKLPTWCVAWVNAYRYNNSASIVPWDAWEESMEHAYITGGQISPDEWNESVVKLRENKVRSLDNQALSTFMNFKQQYAHNWQRLGSGLATYECDTKGTRITGDLAAKADKLAKEIVGWLKEFEAFIERAGELCDAVHELPFPWEQPPPLFAEEE